MARTVFEIYDYDPESSLVKDAMEDARASLRLIDELVMLRRKHGITQRDVAQFMETTQSAVSKFEQAGDPHLSTLQRYARAVKARIRIVVSEDPNARGSLSPVSKATSSAHFESTTAAVLKPSSITQELTGA